MSALKPVTIYTDGACIGNPGPGGYGVVLLYGQHRKELSGGFQLTTNNRMEIFAAIAGLRQLKEKCQVTIYSDSQYLVDAIMKGWATRWHALAAHISFLNATNIIWIAYLRSRHSHTSAVSTRHNH
jgi:ribonuclease HI